MILALLLLPSVLPAQDDVEPGWERSYQAGGIDVNGEFMGGSTIVHLVGHKGKLYAGNSYWLDANHYWYGGANANTPWAQVLRLDSPGGEWVEDLELGPNHLRAEILESVTLTTDHQGNALDTPVNLLVVAEYDSREPNVGINFWIRDDDTGTWAKTLVRTDPAQDDREVHSTRAIQVHKDRATGTDRIFLGVGQIGIVSGGYDPATKKILWDADPETGAIDWSADPPTGLLENRILSIIEANGDLLYSAGRKIYRRNDGSSPTYTLVEDVSDQFPAAANPLGGIRGLSPIPNPAGVGESLIFAMTESNQARGWLVRLDPNDDGSYSRIVEGPLDDDMSDYLDGNPVYFILAAYNEFTPVVDPVTLETVQLVGFESWIGRFQFPLWAADANGGFYKGGMYAIRDTNGDYRLMEVNGRSTETKPPLVAVCTIEISPFAEDGGNALYFGGHDGNHKDPSINRNMAWIFRSSLKQALYGNTINAGRGDIPIHIPTGYDPQTPAPLVILLHGYGGNGTSMAGYLDMAGLAEEYGFMYLSPDGSRESDPNSDGKRFWNATDACCDFYGTTVDDTAYILDLINEMKQNFSVDEDRVFLVGLSNGGFMSHRMACDYPDTISAIVSIAGATHKNSEACSAGSPVRVLQIHGTNDDVILYEGGDNLTAVYPSAVETTEKWALANGCSLTSKTLSTQLDLASDVPGAETVITRYADRCSGEGSAELWTIAGGAHVPVLSSTFSQNIVSWLFEEPYTVPNPTQTASPKTVASLGSTHDMAFGTTNVTGAVCNPCGYQNLANAAIIDGVTASIMPDDPYNYGDTEALGFSNFGFSIPLDHVIDGIAVTIAADVTTHVTAGVGMTMLALTDDVTTAWGINATAGIACELDLLNFEGSSPNNSGSGATGNEVNYPHNGTGLSSPYIALGGPTSLWGSLETITPETVNSANFGLVIHSTAAGPGDVFEIDGVAMTIYHHSVDSYSLADAIMILMSLVGIDTSTLVESVYSPLSLDIDGDNRNGIAEAVYILERVSGIR